MSIRSGTARAISIAIMLGAAGPAFAQPYERDWRRHEAWREQERREHAWHERRAELYRAPPVYYAPRPFYYAPPLSYSVPPTVFYGRPGYGY